MNEPLTEEEFQYLKGDVKRIVCQITEHEVIGFFYRLIATVESLKIDIKAHKKHIAYMEDCKFELKEEISLRIKDANHFREENSKLKAEKETSIYDYADLRKETDRLISQRDLRIKVMEEENLKLKKACEILANKEPIDVGSKNYNEIVGVKSNS